MAYTFRDIIDSLPPEKRQQDGLWTRFVLRPLSIPITWLALALGLSANGVSYISVIFSLTGGVLFSLEGFALPLWGAIILNMFSILDCVDGNIARVTKTAGPWGGWADAVMGFIAYTAVFLSTGIYVYLRTGWWWILVLTALTSSANLLTRVAYQIYKNIEGKTAHGSVSFERKLAENVGVTGFLMPALIICHFSGGMEYIIAFNLLFYLGGCAATIFKLAKKANLAGKSRKESCQT
ncbi:CDP-alcohol phosphatidyltransferase family protein [Treponema primitia]|uniref:CDP-alcohol phosphatidyltransferase family protein n=1 Tax=Treponema primitia TaxID=88058 RepID=UPI00025556AB|nr:CDP-alcohol phosphatidyltransferase family protein [Treponema primitia]